mmetsp:Transcript_19124/g.43724  ORF Transcript_19124/g.43724 Transcript_19124/m.43724 type:complete len:200 (-) Transcript_19124:82-681(-)
MFRYHYEFSHGHGLSRRRTQDLCDRKIHKDLVPWNISQQRVVLDAQKPSRDRMPPELVPGLGRIKAKLAGDAAAGRHAAALVGVVVVFGIGIGLAVNAAESKVRYLFAERSNRLGHAGSGLLGLFAQLGDYLFRVVPSAAGSSGDLDVHWCFAGLNFHHQLVRWDALQVVDLSAETSLLAKEQGRCLVLWAVGFKVRRL